MRLTLAIAVVLLLVPAGPVLTSASAQDRGGIEASNAPWWGPGDRGDASTGWHFRVPILVENTHDYPLRNPIVFAEVDLGKRLVEAGWTARSLGSNSFPTSFTLDTESIRVVPYAAGFSDIASDEPRPSRFYPGRFSTSAGGAYDAQRNPVGTVVFRLDGTLSPGAARPYMVYFTSEEQGSRPAGDQQAPVDGWTARGWGTRAYGFLPAEQPTTATRVDVLARFSSTRVQVSTYEGGQPQPADLSNRPNPFSLDAGQLATVQLPSNTFVKVQSDKPVLVGSRGAFSQGQGTFGGGAFVPAVNGLHAGTEFHLPAYAPSIVVSSTQLGQTDVTVTTPEDTRTRTIGTATPFTRFSLPVDGASPMETATVTSSKHPVTVQYGAPVFGGHDAPSRQGAGAGQDTFTLAPPGSRLSILSTADGTVRVLDPTSSGDQLHPFGDVEETPPAQLEGYPSVLDLATNDSFPEQQPVRVLSTPGENRSAAPLHVSLHTGARAGPYVPTPELQAYVDAPAAVMGAFNATQIETLQPVVGGEDERSTQTLNRDGVLLVEDDGAPGSPPGQVTLTKPAAVVPTERRDTYARFLPSFEARPEVRVGSLDFRGALAQLSLEGAVGGQVVRTVGPGQEVSFQASVENAGHWTGGSPISEEVRLTCSDPGPAWTVEGCGETMTLTSGQSRETEIEITPGDVEPGQRLSLSVQAHGERWNTTDESQIVLLVREAYGVETWFHAEGGPTDLSDAPVFLDPGGTQTLPFVVKNTGTVEDTYDLNLFPPSEGWTIETVQDGNVVRSVAVAPDQTEKLAFRINASSSPRVLSTPIQLEVASTSNELTFDSLRGRAQIFTDLNVSVDTPNPVALVDPGQTHRFPIDVANNGEGIVTVSLNATPAVPPGWTVDVPVDRISVFPGNETRLNVTLALPSDASARERGTISLKTAAARSPGDKPTETTLVLTGLTRHVHALTSPTEPIPVEPGPGTKLNVPIVNTGNGEETVHVLGATPSWPVQAPGPVPIPRNESGVLPLSVDVPSTTPAGERNLTLHLSLARQAERNLTVPLEILETARLDATLDQPKPLLPGSAETFTVTLTADGNVPVHGTPVLEGAGDWAVNATPKRVAIEPGNATEVTYAIRPPEDLAAGAVNATFAVEPRQGTPVEAPPMRFPVGRPDLGLTDPRVREASSGGLLVSAQVSNNGTVAAHDVTVALRSDDGIVTTTDVSQINPQGTAHATLSTSSDDASDLELVVDPRHRFPDPDRSNNALALGSQDVPVFPAAPLALLAAALAARRWTR